MNNRTVPHSRFSEQDVYLFRSGNHTQLYNHFGNHQIEIDGQPGTYFAVYAPAAREVQVVGNFNYWDGRDSKLMVRWDGSGIWEGFIPGVQKGELYKYKIFSNHDTQIREKSDPFSTFYEQAPKTSGITWDTNYDWTDDKWMVKRKAFDAYKTTVTTYELHIGSWRKKVKENRSLHYTEMALEMVDYVKNLGFTHVEFLPISEHPYYPSWGYLSTGYFAPTSRYGNPQEFMALVEAFHNADIGVILDWVPAHFPKDSPFLADFDGTALYEHPDPKKGFHPDWNSNIFNFDRGEVRSFLLSSAHFWLSQYHIDGLRVDAVASMIYLDYSREDGEWSPNEFGSNENLSAISFLKDLNTSCYRDHDGIMMIAEESTSFFGVSKPVHEGGLGFGFKWMMGWMNDSLQYFERDPLYRKHHHNEISFSMAYANTESFVLPLSHDEVVHGKGAIISKMPGDEWQQAANTRLLYSYMYAHPGHKLLFMGSELGQTHEWNVNEGLPWHLLDYHKHIGIQNLIKDLNGLQRSEEALYQKNFDSEGFQWIDHSDHENSILAFIRIGNDSEVIVICNMTPNVLDNYRIGINSAGKYFELFNSDRKSYDGSGVVSLHQQNSDHIVSHGRQNSLVLTLPPLSCVYLKKQQ